MQPAGRAQRGCVRGLSCATPRFQRSDLHGGRVREELDATSGLRRFELASPPVCHELTRSQSEPEEQKEMVKYRELTFEDYAAMFRRRRWLILIPALLGAMVGYTLSWSLPKRYTSHTTILVEQPTVPDSYVKPVVSEDLNKRLASMQEQILSRTRLQHLIEQVGPYGNSANNLLAMQDPVDRLPNPISVTPP